MEHEMKLYLLSHYLPASPLPLPLWLHFLKHQRIHRGIDSVQSLFPKVPAYRLSQRRQCRAPLLHLCLWLWTGLVCNIAWLRAQSTSIDYGCFRIHLPNGLKSDGISASLVEMISSRPLLSLLQSRQRPRLSVSVPPRMLCFTTKSARAPSPLHPLSSLRQLTIHARFTTTYIVVIMLGCEERSFS